MHTGYGKMEQGSGKVEFGGCPQSRMVGFVPPILSAQVQVAPIGPLRVMQGNVTQFSLPR